MKISFAVLITALGLSGCVTSENHGIELAAVSTDCASEGRQKPLAHDSGAGTTWTPPNTARWCDPRGGMALADDPTFNKGSN